jgi:Asp/Glu/hydantoin racemase
VYTGVLRDTKTKQHTREKMIEPERANVRHTASSLTFELPLLLLGCCPITNLPSVLEYTILIPVRDLSSEFRWVGLLSVGPGAVRCVAKAEREVERVQ